ncbi:type II toxin-antitoxin system Phd/YefM family antitoxin [Oxalobacteraceae bacterium]|nr:type II toxin-antitoxin system Phd/YefM family antitoxin [Oxalobacteraceae bacterium]
MLKVNRDAIADELDTYLNQALRQPVVIEKGGHEALVVLSMVEYERLQEAEDEYWATAARLANTEGYIDHDHEVRQRLAARLNATRLGRKDLLPSD